MKVRDSGMPEEANWNDFFNVDFLLSELNIDSQITDLVEIGSGYGTFTIPAARLIQGKLYTLCRCQCRIFENGLIQNIEKLIGNKFQIFD